MKKLIALVAIMALAAPLVAAQNEHNLVGVGGYDLVSYHTGEPLRGSGYHPAVHDGVTYLFANEKNQKAFQANPDKYLPAYGGYCAFGAALGKKFAANPLVWEIVDGRLYLNLDAEIQKKWTADMKGHIEKADTHWQKISGKAPSDL